MPPSPHFLLEGPEDAPDDGMDGTGCLLGVVLGAVIIFAVIMLACAVRVLA
jgi:hypothetical protein